MRSRTVAAFAALTLSLALVASAQAGVRTQRHGSTLRGAPNVGIGCERAIVRDVLSTGARIVPSGQRTCTYRHGGYIGLNNRLGSTVPASGRITRVRIRSGRNPAPARVTILTESGSCCTARLLGPIIRPRPNAITSVRVNIPVRRSFDGRNFSDRDVIGLSFVGRGTLPLRFTGAFGQFAQGSPLATFWYPLTRIGQPRTEHFTVDGLDLLFSWDFVQTRVAN